tara:strand:- start:587 stop:835 length:249 start_codon:yes stop_codon:yes gene_type:complete
MKIISKLGLLLLFGLIIWIAVFIPIDTASTLELLFICYGIAILLAIAFIYIDKKKDKPKGFKRIFFYSLLYGSICFGLFWLI